MAGVRSQLVSLEAQLLELKSQIGAAQSQNTDLVRENFSLMQLPVVMFGFFVAARAPLRRRASRKGQEEANPAGSAKWCLERAPGVSRKNPLALVGPGKAPTPSQQP
jgi:hypothetical protein